jgi:zona occludens toxin (predicted ATPase)
LERVHVRRVALPRTVRAVTVTDPEGDYNVYLNGDLPAEVQRSALEHELRHIGCGHFHNEKSVCFNELEAEKNFFEKS